MKSVLSPCFCYTNATTPASCLVEKSLVELIFENFLLKDNRVSLWLSGGNTQLTADTIRDTLIRT